jgi:hypothetical protein
VGGSGRGLCRNLAVGTEDRHQNLSPYSQSPGRGFNLRPPIYEAKCYPLYCKVQRKYYENVVPVHAMRANVESGGIAPLIPKLGTRWR